MISDLSNDPANAAHLKVLGFEVPVCGPQRLVFRGTPGAALDLRWVDFLDLGPRAAVDKAVRALIAQAALKSVQQFALAIDQYLPEPCTARL